MRVLLTFVSFSLSPLLSTPRYAHWEQRGVPLRLEIGARDLAKNEVVLVRRDTGVKVR